MSMVTSCVFINYIIGNFLKIKKSPDFFRSRALNYLWWVNDMRVLANPFFVAGALLACATAIGEIFIGVSFAMASEYFPANLLNFSGMSLPGIQNPLIIFFKKVTSGPDHRSGPD